MLPSVNYGSPPSYAVHEPVQHTQPALSLSTHAKAESPPPVPSKKQMIQSTVESVHLYRAEPAEVTRVFKVRLVKGRNRVVLRSLPSSASMVPGGVSVRVLPRVDGKDGLEDKEIVTVLDRTLFDETIEDSPPPGYECGLYGVWTSAKLRALNDEYTTAQRDMSRSKEIESALNTSLRDQTYRMLDSPRERRRRRRSYSSGSDADEGGVGIPDLLSLDEVGPPQPEEKQTEAMPRALREYEAAMKLVHERNAVLRAEIARIAAEQEKERREVNKVVEKKRRFSKCVKATLWSKVDSMEVEVVVRYSVHSATWTPRYEVDVRTDPGTGKAKVKLDYIADIWQDTGEEWVNTALTFHTAFSTSNRTLPILRSTDLYVDETTGASQANFPPPAAPVLAAPTSSRDSSPDSPTGPYKPSPPMPVPMPSLVCKNPHCFCGLKDATSFRAGCILVPPNPSDTDSPTEDEPTTRPTCAPPDFDSLSSSPAAQGLRRVRFTKEESVSEKPPSGGDTWESAVPGGDANATLVCPHGVTLSPSGGALHSVTIASIELEAEVTCTATPALDLRTFLHGTMKNTSDYTLAPAEALVRLDGTLTSKSFLPFTRPGDSFNCLLGECPTVEVTYHPRNSKGSVTGLFRKTRKSTFTQRITIRNASTFPMHRVRIIDGIATTFDPRIKTSIVSPALDNSPLLRLSKSALRTKQKAKAIDASSNLVQVGDGVVARWIGDGFDGIERAGDGSAGLVEWVVSGLEPRTTKEVVLEWEVASPVGVAVYSRVL